MVPDALIRQYAGGQVIPILGCEMMRIRSSVDKFTNIHQYIIQKQFHSTPQYPTPPQNMYDLQLIDDRLNQNDISSIYTDIPGDERDTSLLDKIAGMDKFQLYIVASMFTDFEQIFKNKNPGEELELYINDSTNSFQLTNINPASKKRKLVYLFDRAGSPMFAINEEDRLEYLFSLAKTYSIPGSLLSFLAGKTLLFLGCDFSDWFMRYCIRVLYNYPYIYGPRAYIVNDSADPLNYQAQFFAKHKIELIHQYPTGDFIQDLFEKAKGAEEFKDLFNGKYVFLSYTHRDKEHALGVYNCLRNRGVNVWYDDRDKEIGGHIPTIQNQIMNAALTKVMVCVVSAEMMTELADLAHPSYVRDIELDAANTRIKAARMRNETDKFVIVPYFVDDPRPYLGSVPQYISSNFRFGDDFGGCDELFTKIREFLTDHNG